MPDVDVGVLCRSMVISRTRGAYPDIRGERFEKGTYISSASARILLIAMAIRMAQTERARVWM